MKHISHSTQLTLTILPLLALAWHCFATAWRELCAWNAERPKKAARRRVAVYVHRSNLEQLRRIGKVTADTPFRTIA